MSSDYPEIAGRYAPKGYLVFVESDGSMASRLKHKVKKRIMNIVVNH